MTSLKNKVYSQIAYANMVEFFFGEFSLLYPNQDSLKWGAFRYISKDGAMRMMLCRKCTQRVACLSSEGFCAWEIVEFDDNL